MPIASQNFRSLETLALGGHSLFNPRFVLFVWALPNLLTRHATVTGSLWFALRPLASSPHFSTQLLRTSLIRSTSIFLRVEINVGATRPWTYSFGRMFLETSVSRGRRCDSRLLSLIYHVWDNFHTMKPRWAWLMYTLMRFRLSFCAASVVLVT